MAVTARPSSGELVSGVVLEGRQPEPTEPQSQPTEPQRTLLQEGPVNKQHLQLRHRHLHLRHQHSQRSNGDVPPLTDPGARKRPNKETASQVMLVKTTTDVRGH
ncbi:hypothetical protein MRX96_007197 [Rhipicephalus microplus]